MLTENKTTEMRSDAQMFTLISNNLLLEKKHANSQRGKYEQQNRWFSMDRYMGILWKKHISPLYIMPCLAAVSQTAHVAVQLAGA